MSVVLRPVLMIVVGTVMGLGVAEVGFRLYEWSRPAPVPPLQRGMFWQPNADFGWTHPPGREGHWWNDQREFSISVRINSKGLRDVEREYAKPSGVFRILILGDSYMEAIQVELEQSFARLLETMLSTGGRRVEVINAGVSDWGTDNELLYFRHEGFKYEPDLVLLAFTTANDVRNNYPPLNLRVPYVPIKKPTFALRDDGSLELSPAPPPAPPRAPPPPPPWWYRIRVAKFVAARLPLIGVGTVTLNAPPSAQPQRTMATDMLVYSPDYTVEVEQAWKLTKALIRQLRTEVETHSAQLAVVVVNGPWAHSDARWNLMLRFDPTAQKTWIRNRPNQELGDFLSDEGIAFVDLLAPFEAVKDEERLFFQADPHWSAAGHSLAARTTAEFLTARRLVPAVSPDR